MKAQDLSLRGLFSRQELFLIFCLATVQFTHIVDFMIMMPLAPQLMRSLKVTTQEFGLLVSSYTFAAGTMSILSVFFLDRFDRKKALLFFFSLFSVGTVACGFAQSAPQLLAARTLTGAFGGVLGALSLSIVADAIGPERRATATGLLMVGFSVASIVGVPLSIALAQQWDWHAPFIFLGCFSLVASFLFIKGVPPMRGHLDKIPVHQAPWVPFFAVARSRSALAGLLLMFLLVLGQFTIIPFLSPSLVANTGLPESQLPLIYLVGGVCSILSGPMVGRLSDLLGHRKVLTIAALLSLLPMLAVTNLGLTPLPIVLAIAGFLFVFMGARGITSMALLTSTVHPHHRASYMSLISSVQQYSSSIAAFVAGQIVVLDPATGSLHHYSWVGFVAALSTLVSLVTLQWIRPVEDPTEASGRWDNDRSLPQPP